MSKHVQFEYAKESHKGETYGCVWRHATGWGKTPCHYAMNSYRVAGKRIELYNKDHRTTAHQAGYVLDAESLRPSSKIRDLVGAEAGKLDDPGKRKGFMRRFEGMFHSAMHWLRLSPDGWHYDHTISAQHRPRFARERPPQPNFKVAKGASEGYGAWFPYFHNHHHLIPQGAFHQHVIGNDSNSRRRLDIVLASRWNINREDNLVMLPQEVYISEIVGLPAHCPWGVRLHCEYSRSMVQKLKIVKEMIEDAIDSSASPCDEATARVCSELKNLSESILAQVVTMQAGQQVSAVR